MSQPSDSHGHPRPGARLTLWPARPRSRAADGVFEGVVDPDAIIAECDEDNGTARGEADCLL